MTNKIIGVRMGDRLLNVLKEVSIAREENISHFIRRSVKLELARLSYFSIAEKKALGLDVEAP